MNVKRSRIMAIIALLVSCLALYASLKGLLDKNLYQDVVSAGTISESLAIGSIAQDIISIPLSIALALISLLSVKDPGPKKLIALLGLTGYFFYAYGLYVIQGQYTSIYLIYLAVFALSIYAIITGFLSFESITVKTYRLPPALRRAIIFFLLLILSILVPGWLLKISPSIANHIPDSIYAVYILDLAIVFPAFGLTAFMLLQRKAFGIILAGVVLFKIFTVCLSWGFAEIFLTYFGYTANYSMITISGTLTVISLALLVLYMLTVKSEPNPFNRK